MFESLDLLPPDPILGLGQQYAQDNNAEKVGLTIGVYQDINGLTPVLSAVKKAEQQLIDQQQSKVYIAQAGDPDFIKGMNQLLLGDELLSTVQGRLASVMVPGGCGGLRIGAEVINKAKPGASIWLSTPTWDNHYPLLASAGLQTKEYPYYDATSGLVDFEAMLEAISKIPAGDIVLLHACCHNPTGADLSQEQWVQVIDVIEQNNIIPFLDTAYQGFSDSLDDDAFSIREAIKRLPEVIVVSSCSKNFGLYRERTGMLMMLNQDQKQAAAAQSQALSAARKTYSMSPYHGGGIVGKILTTPELNQEWRQEVDEMRGRINSLRQSFVEHVNAKQSAKDFSFIAENRGMFSLLNIGVDAVHKLRADYSIYFLDSTRVNIAGLSTDNIDYVTDAIAKVIS